MTQVKVTIVGAKATDWKSEDGRHYDHVSLYCLVPLDNSQGNAIGKGIIDFKWQDSKNLILLRQHQLPIEAVLDLDMVAGTRGMKQVLTNVTLPTVK